MNEKLLREFISKYAAKEFKPKKKIQMSWWEKIKSFFGSERPSDTMVNEWAEEIEFSYGFEVPTDLLNSAKNLVNSRLEKILQMTQGDAEGAKRIVKRALTKRYSKQLEKLRREILDDEENSLGI